MSPEKRQDGGLGRGSGGPDGEGLEQEFRAMFAERSETVRTTTAPYAAVRQRIAVARRKRRMRIGGAGMAFAVAVAGVGLWATIPGRHQSAVSPATAPPATTSRATGTPAKVFYADGHTELPAGPLRDAAIGWLRARYSGDLSGTSVVTTFDQGIQTAASARTGPGDTGVAILDTRTGAVIALAGAWNRPLPIADLMKPIVLATAFMTRDYSPDSKEPLDAQSHPLYWPPGAHMPMTYAAGSRMKNWPPEAPALDIQNVDVTLRQAVEIGANGPFAQLELEGNVGPDMVRDQAVRMGLPQGSQDLVPVPSLALGVARATPLSMATVYMTFANGGVYRDPQMVWTVEAKDRKTVWTPPDKSEQVIEQSNAQEVTDVLHSALTDGTTGTAVEAKTTAGAQTWAMAGATDTGQAAWFDGADSHYVVSVALSKTGADDLIPKADRNLSGPEVGSRLAGPVWAGLVQTLRNHG